MKYYAEFSDTVERDELLAGTEQAVRVENASVSGGATRGMILCGSDGVYSAVTSKTDKDKPLVIAYEDVAETGTVITPVYTSGVFNNKKLSTGASVVGALDLAESLRRDNILLTEIKSV